MLRAPRRARTARAAHGSEVPAKLGGLGAALRPGLWLGVARVWRRRVESREARRRAGQVDERREDGALVRQVELHQPLQVRLRARLEAVAQHRLRLRAALPLRGAAFAAGVLVLDGLAAQRLLTDDRVGLVAANALDVARRAALRTRLVCVRLAPTLQGKVDAAVGGVLQDVLVGLGKALARCAALLEHEGRIAVALAVLDPRSAVLVQVRRRRLAHRRVGCLGRGLRARAGCCALLEHKARVLLALAVGRPEGTVLVVIRLGAT
mmetsp:Transcript_38486/g.80841  ORF Transcript_38486/g.80841 Transcript_38486/m.80841 type:complete len:265 (-) Transcript_38486:914-1708(-)